MRFRWASVAIFTELGRTRAGHRPDTRSVCCLKPHRWQLDEILTSELNFTGLSPSSLIAAHCNHIGKHVGRCTAEYRPVSRASETTRGRVVFLTDTGRAPTELRPMWNRALQSIVPVADRYKGQRPMLGRNPAVTRPDISASIYCGIFYFRAV